MVQKKAFGIRNSERFGLLKQKCLGLNETEFHAREFVRFSERFSIQRVRFSGLGLTGRGSSIESESDWHASGPEFDPHVRHILSWKLGLENISMAILPFPLIQEEQLSVTGERMCTKYW